jgi:hypothetical protein
MEEHPTTEQLEAFRSGRLSGAAVLDVARHLALCADCRGAAMRGRDVDAAGRALAATITQTESMRQTRWLAGLAAAALVALVLSPLLWHAHRPAPQHVPAAIDYGRADWNQLVRKTLATGTLHYPDAELAALRGNIEVVRGDGMTAPPPELAPAGVILETTRPRFTWPATSGARYTVGVYDGERTVAQSPELRQSEWTPDADLPRGVTCTWDVRAQLRDGSVRIMPAPPAPPARFRILTAEQASELAAARARFPNDPLLLAALYARDGVRDRAGAELRRYAAAHPGSPLARTLTR